jgi:hypothetical protein
VAQGPVASSDAGERSARLAALLGRAALGDQRAFADLYRQAVGAAPFEPGKSLERWMLPEGQAPRSLGVLPAGAIVRVPLAVASEAALAGIPALAVSLEPAGGSPTGLPTGPGAVLGTDRTHVLTEAPLRTYGLRLSV